MANKKGLTSIKNTKQAKKDAAEQTFGMKNKNKSKKVQEFEKQLVSKNVGVEKMRNLMYEEKKKKKAIEEEMKLLGDVLGKVVPKKGEDKICQFFKVGLCNKGKACKFSHDLNAENHAQIIVEEEETNKKNDLDAKIDLFTDQREALFGRKDDITTWDSKKLEEVVNYN